VEGAAGLSATLLLLGVDDVEAGAATAGLAFAGVAGAATEVLSVVAVAIPVVTVGCVCE
jgi:hypothetical protein